MTSENKTSSSKNHFALGLAAAVLIAASGIYFFLHRPAGNTPAGPPEKVTIAFSVSPDSALAQIAQKQGYFLREGLDATAQKHAYGKVALDAMLEGRADIATAAETPVMFAIMNGKEISIIATIQTSIKNNAIVARKDRGIRAPRDLKGKRIAVTSGTLLDFFLDAFLAAQGLSRKDMTVVNMIPEDMVGALERGDVDAISAWSYVLITAQKRLGDNGVTFSDDDIYTQTFNIVTTQDFRRVHPEIINKVLRALIRAEDFAVQMPAEAQAIVADFTSLDKAVISEMWPAENFRVTLDQSLLLSLEDESEWAIKNGLSAAAKIPNYLKYIYFDGLESVKPDAVRIMR